MLKLTVPLSAAFVLTFTSQLAAQWVDPGRHPTSSTKLSECANYVNATAQRIRWENWETGAAPDPKRVETESLKFAKECIAKYKILTTPKDELVLLARLYMGVGDQATAVKVLDRSITLAKTPVEKANALAAAAEPLKPIGGPNVPDTSSVRATAVKGYLKQLDALGDIAAAQRIDTYRKLRDATSDTVKAREYLDKAQIAADKAAASIRVPTAKALAVKTAAVVAASRCDLDPSGPCAKADAHLKTLDAMDDADAYGAKVDAYAEVAAAMASRDEQIEYWKKGIELTLRLSTAKFSEPPNVSLETFYRSLIETYGRLGQLDKMDATLEEARKNVYHGDEVVARWKKEIAIYYLTGKPAPAIAVNYWLPGKATTPAKFEPKDRPLTMIVFTSHKCKAPLNTILPSTIMDCSATYPLIKALIDHYGPSGLDVVLVTKLYRSFEDKDSVTVDAELNLDQEYYADRHSLKAKVGITETPMERDSSTWRRGAKKPARAQWDIDYSVFSLPTVVMVDKAGVVRFASIGYVDSMVRRRLRELMASAK